MHNQNIKRCSANSQRPISSKHKKRQSHRNISYNLTPKHQSKHKSSIVHRISKKSFSSSQYTASTNQNHIISNSLSNQTLSFSISTQKLSPFRRFFSTSTIQQQNNQEQNNASQDQTNQEQKQTNSVQEEQDDDIEPQGPPPKHRFPIPPVPLLRLPRVVAPSTPFFHPLKSLVPEHYPPYALIMDFKEKSSLLGWRIITDSELNGTSEASIAWGTAKCPVTGSPMRTLVFQGRLGKLILPEEVMKKQKEVKKKNDNNSNVFSRLKHSLNLKKKNQDDEVFSSIMGDPNVDYGDATIDSSKSNKQPHKNDDDDDYDSADFDDIHFGALHGFVGLMSPTFSPSLDIVTWDTFNVCVRTDGGPWMSSMKPETLIGTELFMAGLPAPNGNIYYPRKTAGFMRKPMRNLFVPISNMTVSESGRTRSQSEASSSWPCQGFGFSIRGPPGPFKIEIGWIALANSSESHVDTPVIPTPQESMNVDFTPETLKYTAGLKDEQLFDFSQKYRTVIEESIQKRSIEVQNATGNHMIDVENVINVSDIVNERLTPKQLQKVIQEQRGYKATDADTKYYQEKLRQNRDEDYDEQTVESARQGMIDILSQTAKTSDQGGVASKAALDFSKLSSADFEEKLYNIQEKAKTLTGSDLPLILPNYSTETVMAKAREQSARLGFLSQESIDDYLNPLSLDQMEEIDQLASSKKRLEYLENTNSLDSSPLEYLLSSYNTTEDDLRIARHEIKPVSPYVAHVDAQNKLNGQKLAAAQNKADQQTDDDQK